MNECREIKGNSLHGMAVEQLLGRPVSKQRGMHMWRETELFIRQFVFLVPQRCLLARHVGVVTS